MSKFYSSISNLSNDELFKKLNEMNEELILERAKKEVKKISKNVKRINNLKKYISKIKTIIHKNRIIW